MNWKLTSDRPVYIQLIEQIELAIITGQYKSGDKMASVRDLAVEASVNPNTMQRALQEMENTGLLINKGTVGRLITTDTQLISTMKLQISKQILEDFLKNIQKLNYTKEEIIELIQNYEEG